MGGQVAGQGRPAVPVPGRGDDRPVGEHRPGRVAGQRRGHEGQFHDRPQADLHQLVVHPVDPGEVVHRATARFGVHPEVVVQDAVRADGPHAELVVRDPQRLAQFRADRPASGAVPAQRAAQVFRADHRLPTAVPDPKTRRVRRIADLDRDRRPVRGRGRRRYPSDSGPADAPISHRRHRVIANHHLTPNR